MRLEPLYRVRFTYPESWSVGLDPGQAGPDLVMDVAELIWEPIAE
jgi:hypothetical protein